MQTIGEIIPFAKEVLNQRPNWGMLKLYTLGSTLAMLAVVGGLVETVLLPFAEPEPVELVEEEREDREVLKSHTTFVCLHLVSQPPAYMIQKETLVF